MGVLELFVVLAVPTGVALPHLLPLERVTPLTAAAVWLGALALRALVTVGAAVFVFIYLPQTTFFEAVARWCWHQVLPLAAVHLGFSGHAIADFAVVLPGLALAASVLCAGFGLARATVVLSGDLRRSGKGRGPDGSTVVHDAEVLIALTRLGRAKLLISDAALEALDEQELRASLAHEWGHLHRRHRPLLLLGSVLASLARGLPGTRAAERELGFSLERDADDYAVHATRDPLALASAICKAVESSRQTTLALAGRTGVGLRLDHLLHGAPRSQNTGLETVGRLTAALQMGLLLALTVSLPLWALAEPTTAQAWGHLSASCPT